MNRRAIAVLVAAAVSGALILTLVIAVRSSPGTSRYCRSARQRANAAAAWNPENRKSTQTYVRAMLSAFEHVKKGPPPEIAETFKTVHADFDTLATMAVHVGYDLSKLEARDRARFTDPDVSVATAQTQLRDYDRDACRLKQLADPSTTAAAGS